MESIQVIIENADNGFFGRIEGHESYLPCTFGTSINKVVKNLKDLIEDYQIHEKDADDFWLKLDTKKLEFQIIEDKDVDEE